MIGEQGDQMPERLIDERQNDLMGSSSIQYQMLSFIQCFQVSQLDYRGRKKRFLQLFAFCLVTLLVSLILTYTAMTVLVIIGVQLKQLPQDSLLRAQYLTTYEVPLIDGHNDFPSKYMTLLQLNVISQKSKTSSPSRETAVMDNLMHTSQYVFTKKKSNAICDMASFNESSCDSAYFEFNETTSLAFLNYIDKQFKLPLHTDIPRLRKGAVGAQFWIVFTDCNSQNIMKDTITLFDVIYNTVDRYSESLQLALSSKDIWNSFYHHKIASLIGVEGGHMIMDSLSVLRFFYKNGARYLTLTHNCDTSWACSHNTRNDTGLSDFGKSVIREMNLLGMMVDLSHTSIQTMKDAINISLAPVIFSHSNAFSLCPHSRNVPDDVIVLLEKNNGIIMVNYFPPFVSEEEYKHSKSINASGSQWTEAMQQWYQNHPEKRANVSQIVDHIFYIANLTASCDFIGIGADFDGISVTTSDAYDVSRHVHVVAEMIDRGFSDECVTKILGKNLLRVMKEVESVSQDLKKSHDGFIEYS